MSHYTILITDDDESTHDVLGSYLELSGFRVLHARDGAAGLVTIEQMRPDLVLLDVNMPIMDGFKTMEMIAKNRELRDIPVLFLTSLDRENLKIKGLELGAEDYIIKPFKKAELLARVKAALRRSERYRRSEKTMDGNLADITLAELLQTFDIGRKTACVHLREIDGRLCVEEGSIVHAAYRDIQGAEAVTRIFFLEKGLFSVTFDPPAAEMERTPLPIQKTIFETVAYVDELRKIVSDFSSEDDLIEIKETGDPEIERFRPLSPLRLRDLLCYMQGDLKENAARIGAAMKNSTLSVVA